MSQIINFDALSALAAEVVMTAAKYPKTVVIEFDLFDGFTGAYPIDQVPRHPKEAPVLQLRGGKTTMEEISPRVVEAARMYEYYQKYPQPMLFEEE